MHVFVIFVSYSANSHHRCTEATIALSVGPVCLLYCIILSREKDFHLLSALYLFYNTAFVLNLILKHSVNR